MLFVSWESPRITSPAYNNYMLSDSIQQTLTPGNANLRQLEECWSTCLYQHGNISLCLLFAFLRKIAPDDFKMLKLTDCGAVLDSLTLSVCLFERVSDVESF